MEKIEILRIESLSRDPLVVEGYLFKGTNPNAPKIAIVGAMEGESILPLYCASTLVDFFKNKLEKEKLKGDVLIDDYIEGRGQENFEGEFIHFGSEEFPNWEIIYQYLNSKF